MGMGMIHKIKLSNRSDPQPGIRIEIKVIKKSEDNEKIRIFRAFYQFIFLLFQRYAQKREILPKVVYGPVTMG